LNLEFLDFEATSLGPDSRPIEVAICDATGVFEAYYIKPEPSWVDWDPASEAVHGISQVEIATFGRDARQAANRVFDLLIAADTIYSDHPAHDEAWLAELMHVGGYAPRGFRLHDVAELYDHTVYRVMRRDGAQKSLKLIDEAKAAEARRVRTRHRAGPDARGLWWTWMKLIRLVQLTGA
jgi:hypothetical protein